MGYKQAYLYEGRSDAGEIGIKVMLSIERELTDKDNYVISEAVERIHDGIIAETIKINPLTAKYRKAEREEILALFPDKIFVEEIPNGYCSKYCSKYCCREKPWFIVTTSLGRIKIGWRKSVIHIEWT